MGFHLLNAAAEVTSKPSQKLVLMCLAKEGDDRQRVSFPGVETLLKWSGLSRPQLFRVLAQLIELKLIEQRQRGHRGKRAEFIVFPLGCCEAHGKESFGSHERDPEDDVKGLTDVTLSDPVDSCTSETSRPEKGLTSGRKGLISGAKGSHPDETPQLETYSTRDIRVVTKPDPSPAADPPNGNVVGFHHWRERKAS